ncbi:heavy metal-associated isoprenylated plant protein 23 [Hordeum vulgare subsp. vulgare]|uniref:HMA domain-containing protein n=1 Tax=Hordeum vulgare subsp. vulgare TaxID=112509 RepID=A0A8I7BHF7_HORVV|nr:heavy metal-associated isoprenylated plant protein 23 [Hordeum vulgare subsp. vulgare]
MGSGIKQLLASLVGGGHGGGRKERRQPQTVELRVRMDCERCERQVKKALVGIRGVECVEVNGKQQRVTVTGVVDPCTVLRRAQSTGKKAELWPRNQHHHHPSYCCDNSAAITAHYGATGPAQAHERWAPSPHSRSADAIGAEKIASLFSDENPNACSVM